MDAALVSELLHVLLHREVVSVDAYDVSDASTFYNRVLDTLANWPSAYDNRRRGVETWNGRGLDAMDEDGRWAQDVRAPSTTSKGILAAHANDNFATFEHALHTLWALPSPTRCHLVVTNAERLFELADQSGPKAAKDNIASAMVDLSMRSGGRLTSIFITPTSQAQFATAGRLRMDLPTMRFVSLAKEDVLGLLCHGFRPALSVRAPLQASSNGSNGHLASDTQRSLFRSLASYCYDAVATTVPASDIVNTTGVLVEQLWQQWTERVVKGTAHASETAKLITHIKDDLPIVLTRLANPLVRPAVKQGNIASLTKSLPTMAKLLLLSAYLACTVASRRDITLYTTHQQGPGKRAKTNARVTKGQELDLLSGPKAVAIERIAAIYDSLLVHLPPGRAKICRDSDGQLASQISTLLSLGLLSRVGPERLDAVKLKIALSREEAVALARGVAVPLEDYMR